MTKMKRITSVFLILCMILSAKPMHVPAAAADPKDTDEQTVIAADAGAAGIYTVPPDIADASIDLKKGVFQSAPPAALVNPESLTPDDAGAGFSTSDGEASLLAGTGARALGHSYMYYYAQLSDAAKTVYNNLLSSSSLAKMRNGETIHAWSSESFTFTEENWNDDYEYWWQNIVFRDTFTHLDALLEAYEVLYFDHPEIFWAGCITYYWSVQEVLPNGTWRELREDESYEVGRTYAACVNVTFDLLPPWNGSRSVTADEAAISSRISAITAQVDKKASRYRQVLQVHDWLTKNNSYNVSAANSDSNLPWSPLSALSTSESPVCTGYAKAFKLICDNLNIPCILVGGTGITDSSAAGHMWNYVQMEDGKWYAVDVTYDDPMLPNASGHESGAENHNYFLVGSNSAINGTLFSASHLADTLHKQDGSSFYLPSFSDSAYRSSETFTVTFDTNGGGMAPSSLQVTNGKPYGRLPDANKLAHTFLGWYTAAEGGKPITGEMEVDLCADQTLYAHWKEGPPAIRTIYFDANGGKVNSLFLQRKDGEIYGDLPVPTRQGYTFNGWYTAEKGGKPITGDMVILLDKNQTLYAHWLNGDSNAVCTVNFHAMGGTTPVLRKKVVKGEPYGDLPVPTRNGYTFSGWYTEDGKQQVTSATIVELRADQTLYAHWRNNHPSSWQVHFRAGSGTVSPVSKRVTNGEVYGELPTPIRDGYVFDGWYPSPIEGKPITSTKTVDLGADQVLYAHWAKEPLADYTVTFHANGVPADTTSKKVKYGGLYGNLPSLSRRNYRFEGWYPSKISDHAVTAYTEVSLQADHTLYARWTYMVETDIPIARAPAVQEIAPSVAEEYQDEVTKAAGSVTGIESLLSDDAIAESLIHIAEEHQGNASKIEVYLYVRAVDYTPADDADPSSRAALKLDITPMYQLRDANDAILENSQTELETGTLETAAPITVTLPDGFLPDANTRVTVIHYDRDMNIRERLPAVVTAATNDDGEEVYQATFYATSFSAYELVAASVLDSERMEVKLLPDLKRVELVNINHFPALSTVYAASYANGKMLSVVSGTISNGIVTFSRELQAGDTLFFLDADSAPLCEKVVIDLQSLKAAGDRD